MGNLKIPSVDDLVIGIFSLFFNFPRLTYDIIIKAPTFRLWNRNQFMNYFRKNTYDLQGQYTTFVSIQQDEAQPRKIRNRTM